MWSIPQSGRKVAQYKLMNATEMSLLQSDDQFAVFQGKDNSRFYLMILMFNLDHFQHMNLQNSEGLHSFSHFKDVDPRSINNHCQLFLHFLFTCPKDSVDLLCRASVDDPSVKWFHDHLFRRKLTETEAISSGISTCGT